MILEPHERAIAERLKDAINRFNVERTAVADFSGSCALRPRPAN